MFILSIPKPLVDLNQLEDATTHPALEEAKKLLNDLNVSNDTITKDIDKAAQLVIATLLNYHTLAQTIWPIAQTHDPDQSHKIRTPKKKSDIRQIKCIT
jgi:hypothetical protein